MLNRSLKRPLDREKYVIRAWLFVAVQAGIFAVLVTEFQQLQGRFPDIFDTNRARLLLPAWAGLLILQLLIVIIYDFRTVRIRERNRRIRERLERAPEPLPSDGHVMQSGSVDDQLSEDGYAPLPQMQTRKSSDVVWYEPNND